MRILVALGGNAILQRGERGTVDEQVANVSKACGHLAGIIRRGHNLVITHGNGPQVGDILLKDELSREALPPMPLDVCGAESQGMIGYFIQQAMRNALEKAGLELQVVTVLTETVVDADDPAFKNPTKPIGPFYTATEAAELGKEKGWHIIEDSGRGYRRAVPSPLPLSIVQGEVIRRLTDLGVVVIAAGGGGIPVTVGEEAHGVEAVIDKDLGAAVLAKTVNAEALMILTDVENVYLDFRKPSQRAIKRITAGECRDLLTRGEFPSGSMAPKIESAVRFLESGKGKVIITSLESAEEALSGRAGTTIVP